MKEKWNLNGIQIHELNLNFQNKQLSKNLTRVNDIQIHDLCCGFFHFGAVVNLVLYQTSKRKKRRLLKRKRNRLPTSYTLTNPCEKLWVKLKKMFQMSLQPSTSSSPAYQRLPTRSLARRIIVVITYYYYYY